ncbi:MAG: heparan-alpha-glucosaminide N-acetyltransferase [Desulfohalobiaceae bacterium]
MKRWQILDQARGLAILLMIGFHFCFDLDQLFHVIDINIKTDPFWTGLRSLILSIFILIAGISLTLSTHNRPGLAQHLKKQKWLAVCALLVSLGTFFMFPESWIYFGVLHFILLARIVCYTCPNYFVLNIFLGLLILAIGLSWASPVFDPKWINWVGLSAHKPFTEDYVPIFPWLGIFLFGIFAGRLLFLVAQHLAGAQISPFAWLNSFLDRLGRNSLSIYMLHQPIMISILYLILG